MSFRPPPNTRVQRTRSSASPSRSPLTSYPLGAPSWLVAVVATVLGASASFGASEGIIAIHIACPATAKVGEKITCRFEVENVGTDGVYFEKPWKWAKGAMQVIATGADGSRYESTPVILDIDRSRTCYFLKPLGRGDRFSFEEDLVIGPKPAVDVSSPPPVEVVERLLYPHLELRAGEYKIKWVYEPRLDEDEQRCAVADAQVWSGHVESTDIQLKVSR